MTCDHKFIDSNHCLKCGWESPKYASRPTKPQGANASATTVKMDIDELHDKVKCAINGARKFRNHIPTVAVEALKLADLIAEVRASRAAAEWRPVIGADGLVAVDEGKSYLFAIQVSTNGAPWIWEYWQDSIVWDAETEPDFTGDPGWDISDEVYFRELPSPPRSEP